MQGKNTHEIISRYGNIQYSCVSAGCWCIALYIRCFWSLSFGENGIYDICINTTNHYHHHHFVRSSNFKLIMYLFIYILFILLKICVLSYLFVSTKKFSLVFLPIFTWAYFVHLYSMYTYNGEVLKEQKPSGF